MKGTLVINGGRYKGKRITCPPGEIRPAMSVMREVLFQVLANMLQGTPHQFESIQSVVDLFCGSGLLALEFFSRGAKRVICVESDRQKWNVIINNIRHVTQDTCTSQTSDTKKTRDKKVFLYKDKAERFIMKHLRSHDIIYCDPPFAYAHKQDLLLKIASSQLLHNNSIVIIHVSTQEKLQSAYGVLQGINMRCIGSSSLYFYEKKI